jgi:Protein of unknown function (DUF4058)
MECPFPGMDPYIERPAIWADFHDSLITEIRRELQPLLRPKYVALAQDLLYVVASKRSIWPDVAVVEPRASNPNGAASVAVVEADEPTIFELGDDEVREPYIEIIEPAAGNRLITAIEVLSPDNKVGGAGRRKYLRKKREIRKGRANLVEIDLLRAGKPTFRLSADDLAKLPAWHYLVAVTRRPRRQEVYAIALEKRLPRLRIPLTKNDADVRLDLQAAFTRVWQDGPYPELLNYDGPPPGALTPVEIAWCEEPLRQAGLRS